MADTNSRAGARYSSQAILEWAAATHAPHDAGLAAAFGAPAKLGLPEVQLGPSEAKFLGLLLRLVGARKVVELGTLAGYSALWLSRALGSDGHLWTIEADLRHADVARGVLQEAGAKNVEVVVGKGAEVLPALERHGPFCAVFVDADKESYDIYGRWAAAHTRPGGLLIADNAFLFGELLEETPRAKVMRRCHLEAREAYDSVCLPTPDGLLVGIRR
jgi:caffeoyl-CoA O-methyltransferase